MFLASPSPLRLICDNQIQSKYIHKLSSRIHLTNNSLQGGLENEEIKHIDCKGVVKPRNSTAMPFPIDLGRGRNENPGCGCRTVVTLWKCLSTGVNLSLLRFLWGFEMIQKSYGCFRRVFTNCFNGPEPKLIWSHTGMLAFSGCLKTCSCWHIKCCHVVGKDNQTLPCFKYRAGVFAYFCMMLDQMSIFICYG